MIDPDCEQFLVERVGGVAYAERGDLLAHLRNTHALLQGWGSPPALCLAGLFHSIYGTWYVSHRAASFAERGTVRALIGEEAESLAYIFGVSERPKDFLECLDRGTVEIKDHHTGAVMVLRREALDQLLEMEAANIIEQGVPAYAVLEQCLRARLTPGAIEAVEAYIEKGRQPAVPL